MRISQLQSLTLDELGLLLYIFNDLYPIKPGPKITSKMLLFIKDDVILWTLAQCESKIKPEYKYIINNLSIKLNKTWIQEIQEYENTSKPLFTQSKFQF